MPIQPGLALQVKGLELPDPLAMQAQATQIQNALQQQRMGEMQIQNAMREQRREQDYETVLSGFKPGMSLEERVAALQQRGLGAKGAQYAETQLKLDKANREAEAARIKAQTDRIGLMGQLLSGVSDQSTLDAVRPQIARIPGVTEDDLRMLQTYGDGSTIKRLANASMTAYQRGSLANAQMTAEAGKERARAATSQAETAAARLPFERQRTEAAALQAATAADRAKFERENPGFTIQETDKGLFKVNKRTGATEPLMAEGKPLQTSAKGSRPQLLQLQDELRRLKEAGQGDSPEARQIEDQIRANTVKGSFDLSPAEIQKREAARPKAELAFRTFDETTDALIADIKKLRDHKGLAGITGPVYGRTPSVTEESTNAQAILDKILARGGFQELANLRQSSPTGGALGNITDTENKYLRQAFGALNQTQSTKYFKGSLDQVISDLENAKSRVKDAYESTYAYQKALKGVAGSQLSATPRGRAAVTPGETEVDFGSLK